MPVTDRGAHAHPAAAGPVDARGGASGGTSAGVGGGPSKRMPWGVALFLGYAFLILAIVALSLPTVIDLAIDTPVSFVGLVVMALLAYTIFTITLFLQRKAAARTLGLGLWSLTVPLVAIALVSGLAPPALVLALFAGLLLRGLTRPAVTRWLDEV